MEAQKIGKIEFGKEFDVKGRTEKFRFVSPNPVKLFAISTQYDLENPDKLEKFMTFVLENTEVLILGKWLRVKEGETFTPETMKHDFQAWYDLMVKFSRDIVVPTFKKSNGLNKDIQ